MACAKYKKSILVKKKDELIVYLYYATLNFKFRGYVYFYFLVKTFTISVFL